MQQWWLAVATGLAASIGYLVKRWVERRARDEGLKRRLQALSLLRGMRREGISMRDLQQIEREAAEN